MKAARMVPGTRPTGDRLKPASDDFPPTSKAAVCLWPQQAALRSQLRWILSDIAVHPFVVLLAADQSIPIVRLPKRSRLALPQINLPCREPLPRMHKRRKLMARHRCEKHMHVIRHHHIGGKLIPFPVEMMESIRHDPGIGGITKEARPRARIQPLVDFVGESLVIELFGPFVPRQRTVLQPDFPLLPPRFDLGKREGVREPPSEEDPRLRLLPVG